MPASAPDADATRWPLSLSFRFCGLALIRPAASWRLGNLRVRGTAMLRPHQGGTRLVRAEPLRAHGRLFLPCVLGGQGVRASKKAHWGAHFWPPPPRTRNLSHFSLPPRRKDSFSSWWHLCAREVGPQWGFVWPLAPRAPWCPRCVLLQTLSIASLLYLQGFGCVTSMWSVRCGATNPQ